MDDFKIIYRILQYIKNAREYDNPDYVFISPEALGISRNRWIDIMYLLVKEGFIDNIHIIENIDGHVKPYIVEPIKPRITLKGLEYLQENSMMKKAKSLLTGVLETAVQTATETAVNKIMK